MDNMVCAGLDEDILSTGITLYQLREGDTIIGNAEADEIPHIILKGPRSESHPLICPLRIRIQIPAMLHLDPNWGSKLIQDKMSGIPVLEWSAKQA